jgi:hypothetical protein
MTEFRKKETLTNEVGRIRTSKSDSIKKTVSDYWGKKDSPVFIPRRKKFKAGRR